MQIPAEAQGISAKDLLNIDKPPAAQNGDGGTSHSYTVIQDDISSSGPFEGPEKLLELWFAPSVNDIATLNQSVGPRSEIKGVLEGDDAHRKLIGLRRVEKDVWKQMLDLVKCKVLSVIEGQDLDAYLLSESSMFVWPHKLILKTCGTTTLLLGLKTLLQIAHDKCGLSTVWRCFYSRKTFMFPDRQLGPHKTWAEEVAFLDQILEGGSAYTVGKMNGDHWMLYMTSPVGDSSLCVATNIPAINSLSVDSSSPFSSSPRPPIPCPSEPDSTLEILMSGLSAKASSLFFASTKYGETSPTPTRYPDEPADGHAPGLALLSQLGLNDASLLGEEVLCDAFLFAPCGFSANLISASDGAQAGASGAGGRYATVHVTPEEGWSFASFECNIDFSGHAGGGQGRCGGEGRLGTLVAKVLSVFQPKRMSITLFVSQDVGDDQGPVSSSSSPAGVDDAASVRHDGLRTILRKDLAKGYKRTDRIVYEFEGYDLVFATFERT